MVNADPMTERVSWRQAAASRVVIADDVNNRTDDLIRPGADRGEHRSGVGGDLVNLHVDVSGADQRTERVERALPRQERETPGLDDCDVMVTGWVVPLYWVVASDHRGHAAHPAPPEKPDATHQRRTPRAVDQASLAQRPRENLLAGSLPHGHGQGTQQPPPLGWWLAFDHAAVGITARTPRVDTEDDRVLC